MKQRLLLFVLLFSTLALTAQMPAVDVPQKQIPVITKISATWCPLCGGWGWDFFSGLREDNNQDALMITAHYSGNYQNAVASTMAENFGIIGQPEFYLNSGKIPANSSNFSTVRGDVRQQVLQQIDQNPVVQSGLLAATDEGKLKIFTKTRFFQDAGGEYFLAIYLLEKTVTGYQAGQGDNAQHKFILRQSVTAGTFGQALASGNIQAGTEVSINKETSLGSISYDLDNLVIATVIYRKENNKYLIVNGNRTDEILATLTGTENLLENGLAAGVWSNPAGQSADIRLDLPEDFNHLALDVIDLSGRPVLNLFRGRMQAGLHQFTVQRQDLPAAGLFLVRISDGRSAFSRKVVFVK